MDIYGALLEGWNNYRGEITVALITAFLFWIYSKKVEGIEGKVKKYLRGGKKVEKELFHSLWQIAKESFGFLNWGYIIILGSLALLLFSIHIWRYK